ncbi:putative bifunctional inhibitor/plant lipid transfer protein/seed storage helical [Helianthus annuus]|nr:putative bifunctional inhibitor/plant lipid transfer protein/seed storage helical [Helianthus annuus]
MASKMVGMVLAMVLIVSICGGAMAQSGCTNALMGMSSCLNFITGNTSTPSSSCCSQLGNVVQSQPQCLCQVLNGAGINLGISINRTLALTLPGACNVQTPPVSQCDAANGPPATPTPAASPEGSTFEPNILPESPTESDTPSGIKVILGKVHPHVLGSIYANSSHHSDWASKLKHTWVRLRGMVGRGLGLGWGIC